MSGRFYSEKLKRAVHLLLFRRGKFPGAKEWELKRALGGNYEEVLAQLNELLEDLDLEIKRVDEGSPASSEQGGEARHIVRLKGTLTPREARMIGWRIDSLAALTAAISYIIAKQGKAPRQEVEQILSEKLGRWRSMALIDTFIRSGYLSEDEEGLLALAWRTRAEVDLKSLMGLLAEVRPRSP